MHHDESKSTLKDFQDESKSNLKALLEQARKAHGRVNDKDLDVDAAIMQMRSI